MHIGLNGKKEANVITVQVFELKPGSSDLVDFFLLILPACCILMAERMILKKIHEWNTMKIERRGGENGF